MSVSEAPILFFAPFVSSTMRVDPAWIDVNDHMNLAYYHVLFDRALDEAFSIVGLSADYIGARNASYFAAECHIRYLRELKSGDAVRTTLQMLDFDEKRLHYFMTLRHASEGWISATSENMSLHIDMATRKVSPFPADILANLAIMKAMHARMPRPADIGRTIAIPRRAGEDGERGALN